MIKTEEKGFVLATSLVILLLMTILTAAVFISVDSSQKSSMAAESSTQAFYYAETAVNYMSWALFNNAEFDSYTYPSPVKNTGVGNQFKFDEPIPRGTYVSTPSQLRLVDPSVAGDYQEWRTNRGNPNGDTLVLKPDGTFVVSVVAPNGDAYGQLMYYDNKALSSRIIYVANQDIYSLANTTAGLPDLYKIHRKLPRYIMLSIDGYGNILPSMPIYTAAGPNTHGDVMGVDYPENGALLWLTGGNAVTDYELAPIDKFNAPTISVTAPIGGPVVTVYDKRNAYIAVAGDPYATLSCFVTNPYASDIACSADGTWLKGSDYGLVIYALGYVRGRARKLIRVVYQQ